MKNKRKMKETGITLIALVVTIIVLLILAGITINLAMGSNGLIKKTKEAEVEVYIADLEEQANLIYQDLLVEYYTEPNNDEVTINNVIEELKKDDKYSNRISNYKGKVVKGLTYKDINDNPMSSSNIIVEKDDEKFYKVEVVVEEQEDANYCVLVNEKKHPIVLINERIKVLRTEELSEDYTITALSDRTNIIDAKVENSILTITGHAEGNATLSMNVNGVEIEKIELSTKRNNTITNCKNE